MAKKMSTGKVVALALCVIVGAGSIAALARGRDKDEDEVKEPAHVHSYAESNVCSCGERQETILLSDVKVGMDLSGYAMRTTVSKEEFDEVFLNGGLGSYNYSAISVYITGENFNITTVITGLHLVSSIDDLNNPTVDESLFRDYSSTGCVIPNGSIVKTVEISGEYLDYFEFYYVGEAPAPASYALPKGKAAQKEPQVETPAPEKETEDFGCVGNELPENSDLWTTLF